jgi:hypothetical protein
MIIRAMETREIDLVITLFNYYRVEADIADDLYDENRVLSTIREYNIRPNLFFRVAYNGTRPVGLIGGFLSEDPIELEITATIQFNYLIPEFASVDNYGLLIDEFETWASQFKCTQMRAIDIGKNINRLNKIYDQLAFDPVKVTIMNKEIA